MPDVTQRRAGLQARMQALVFIALTASSTGLSRFWHVAGVTSVPELSFVLQAGALATAIGSAVAARAKRRNPDADTWAITTAWATLGSALAALVVAAERLLCPRHRIPPVSAEE
jgi:hypothetical protein